MKKILRFLFNPDIFKAVFFLISLLGVCPLLIGYIEPYLKVLHVYTIIVLAIDLLGERRILKNKGRTVLLVFCCGYMMTLLTNRTLISFSGLSNFMYLFATLALVYSYSSGSHKIDCITSTALITLITLANVVGIWMFYTKYYQVVPTRGFVGMYPHENRLAGLFGNPNVLGMVCLSALSLCFIQIACSVGGTRKFYFVGCGLVNFVTLLLSNSRTQIYSLILLFGVIAFMWALKATKDWKRWILACVAFALCVGVVFGGCRLAQQALSKFDFYYNYYLTFICEDTSTIESTGAESAETGSAETESVEADFTEPEPTALNLSGTTIARTESVLLNGRLGIWATGFEVFKEKPLFGCGMDNFEVTLENMGKQNLEVKGNLHNTYLEILADFGLTGFACLTVFLLTMLKNVIAFFQYGDRGKWMQGTVMLACVCAFMLDAVADSTLVASVYPTAVCFWYIVSRFVSFLEDENAPKGHFKPEPLGIWGDKVITKFKKER